MTVTETLYISSKKRTVKIDQFSNFSIKLNKTYRNVKHVKLKKIPLMNSWYNVDFQNKKLVIYFGGVVDATLSIELNHGYYSIPSLCDAIIAKVNSALSGPHPTITMSTDLDFLIQASKVKFSLNTNDVPFTFKLNDSTIDRGLLGFFDEESDIVSVSYDNMQSLMSSGIASVYIDDFLFMKIHELEDTVFVADGIQRYTFVIQNPTEKLDNLILNDEQVTKPISSEFNQLTISLYNEKHELITLRNNYSFLLEIEYCNR